MQEASTAKYIIQQYTAAIGGQVAMNSVSSMCVTGQVKIKASDFYQGEETIDGKSTQEVGGFVLWQRNPDLWSLEIVVSGCKVICGSNGKLSWRHSSNQQTPISKGPPRPLRRFLQVIDQLKLQDQSLWTLSLGGLMNKYTVCIHKKQKKKIVS